MLFYYHYYTTLIIKFNIKIIKDIKNYIYQWNQAPYNSLLSMSKFKKALKDMPKKPQTPYLKIRS